MRRRLAEALDRPRRSSPVPWHATPARWRRRAPGVEASPGYRRRSAASYAQRFCFFMPSGSHPVGLKQDLAMSVSIHGCLLLLDVCRRPLSGAGFFDADGRAPPIASPMPSGYLLLTKR